MIKTAIVYLFTVVLVVLSSVAVQAKSKYDCIVARDGSGNIKSLQAAIDAAPSDRTTPYRIFVKSGLYLEQILIPANKPFLELIGEDPQTTVVSFGDGKGGTSTVTINANDCMLMNITLENSQGRISDGPQSLAVKTNGSRAVFYHCRFISGQDTVLVGVAGSLIYFNDCYIDGNTDFVFGAATAVFDRCVIYPRDRIDGSKGGYFTAASTPAGQTYGFVFRDCVITNNHGITLYTLGRPWQNDASTELKGRKRASNNVVFLNTRMGSSISQEGWSMWDTGTVTGVITYAEYHSRRLDGSLLNVTGRVLWSKQLSDNEAAQYFNNAALFGQWKPFMLWPDLASGTKGEFVTVTNFLARNIGGEAVLQFNSSWPLIGVTYELYKRRNTSSSFKKIATLTTRTDTTVAYQFKEILPGEQTVDYLIKATKNKVIRWSDTLKVTSTNILKQKRK
jgi:pectin methylesterase-like acyl-CoA thioesterase